ncbi:MAG: RNase J family beta-CASP ribonuclease [Dehalococcoidia bacterium]|nr:RNase J family beta-CASP ribonuclease [Dehalococcoidia bacterium]
MDIFKRPEREQAAAANGSEPWLRVVPLGGLGEIGKNMMVLETANDLVVVDCGLMFPEEEMLGVDLVIPDITYLHENSHKLRGIFITHGHEDHTGALPYVLRELQTRVYCTRLTRGLIAVKLKEHRVLNEDELLTVETGEVIQAGTDFQVEFFSVAHSIPDAAGLAIRTPLGTVIHTGDFKLDHTPVMGKGTDLPRLAELGREGVLLLCSDSTYAELPGYTPSEQVVGEALDRIISQAPGRVIVTTFASLIARVHQVIDAAVNHNRRVFITGRSMVDNVNIAMELGYLKGPASGFLKVDDLRELPPEKIVVISTGSQGEPTSALARMSNGDHQHIQIMHGDTVIMSSSPVPGNEALVYRVVDNLFRLGAGVFYNRISNVHVHGHASQEELKVVFNLVRPRHFVPIHGEYRHLALHARLAQTMGVPPDNIFILQDGDALEFRPEGASLAGKVTCDWVYVDGLGVGDVDHVVLRDRKHLATDGILAIIIAVEQRTGRIVGRPDVVSRGFVDVEESEALLEETRQRVAQSLDGATDHAAEWGVVKTTVKDAVADFLYQKTRRRPMILPVVVEV